MENCVSSIDVSDAFNDKKGEAKKERPKSLDLETCDFGNDEQQTPDDTMARQTTR